MFKTLKTLKRIKEEIRSLGEISQYIMSRIEPPRYNIGDVVGVHEGMGAIGYSTKNSSASIADLFGTDSYVIDEVYFSFIDKSWQYTLVFPNIDIQLVNVNQKQIYKL